jgi:uncharacterized membrane-anchored protein
VKLPVDHPQRRELNDEVHARPPEVLTAPCAISYLVLFSDWTNAEAERGLVGTLVAPAGLAAPAPGTNHFTADLGSWRLRWERHTEFARYTIIAPGGAEPFAAPAIARVPADWLAALPGELMLATHVALVPRADVTGDADAIGARWFGGNPLLGSGIAGGAATALTDLRIQADGFGRLLVADGGMTARQAGRMVQRLLEIDTYRLMALLALPVARKLAPALTRCERELAEITRTLTGARPADEPVLLERLTRLEAEVEGMEADHHYRFTAADAYHELVERRIDELREERMAGLQTFQEFTERRLAPAINTCRAVAARQESLSQRVARATQLLSTRVDVTRERQNQAVLASMNRRAHLQLRLQQTVEGLSIAAMTYYVTGLVAYAAKALKGAGWRFDVDIVVGASIPVVAVLLALGVRRIRRRIERGGGEGGSGEGAPS